MTLEEYLRSDAQFELKYTALINALVSRDTFVCLGEALLEGIDGEEKERCKVLIDKLRRSVSARKTIPSRD